jgi:methyltransferase (TIGR00027 family)
MRRGRASATSSLVTLLRALAHEGLTEVRDFSDPTALPMLPPAWQLLFRLTQRRARNPWFRQRMLNPKSGARSDLVPLRTRVFDDAWHDAHASGVRQLVLLGAGLDGRAFRLNDIADSCLFEVDHPATQRLKRERAASLVSRAKRHTYVAVDFENDSLPRALEVAGQRADAPTYWIWEGVTPYLTRQAQRETLRGIAERSAIGSRIALTYVEPGDAKNGGTVRRIALVVRLFGEPFVGTMTRTDAADLLADAGFRVVEDSDAQSWRQRYTDNASRRPDTFLERIAIAEKIG